MSSPTATRRPSLGDRVEEAISEHADAELEIERGEAESARSAPSLRRTVFWLAVTGVSLYLVAPSLLDVLGSWRDLRRIDLIWFPAMGLLQAAGLACLWALQRMALHRARWPDVIESQLAGNALGKIAPAGGAVGAALQYRMLVESGLERGRTVAGITAVNLLTFAVVLALPVLALPALLRRLGEPQPRRRDPDRRRRLRRPAVRRRGRGACLRSPARGGRPARTERSATGAPARRRAVAALARSACVASATS